MKYKKPKKWIQVLAVVCVCALGTSCLTNGNAKNKESAGSTVSGGKNSAAGLDGNTGTDGTTGTDNSSTAAGTLHAGTATEPMASGDSTKFALEKKNYAGTQYKTITSALVNGTEVSLVHFKPEGYSLVTSRNGEFIDEMRLSAMRFNVNSEAFQFPDSGFPLVLADYDGDGMKNDFSLGLGQTYPAELGNCMKYAFFGVDKDGTLISYNTSEEDFSSILTAPPDVPSKKFKAENGCIKFKRPSGKGLQSKETYISRKTGLDEVKEKNLEPESQTLEKVKKTMPDDVVRELEKKIVFTRSYMENGQMCVSIGNDAYEPTLRLDFCYGSNGRLLQYDSKEYGFVDGLKKKKGKANPIPAIIDFAKEFFGLTLSSGQPAEHGDIPTFDDGKEPDGRTAVWQEQQKATSRWKPYLTYRDEKGNFYVTEDRQGMVVNAYSAKD